MKKAANAKSPATRKSTRTAKKKTASPTQPASNRPGGKLRLILDRLSTKDGTTADELVDATGWQRHSVLGALSKLKARGFVFNLDVHASRKAYRLINVTG